MLRSLTKLVLLILALAPAVAAQNNFSLTKPGDVSDEIIPDQNGVSNLTLVNSANSDSDVRIEVRDQNNQLKASATVEPGDSGQVPVGNRHKVTIIYVSTENGTATGTWTNTFPPE